MVPIHALLRNALAERPLDALLNLEESVLYSGLSAKTLRNQILIGKLQPDARGYRRTPIFRKATLDAFLAGRR